MATTANLLITHIEQSQSQKEVTANEAFDILDAATQGALSVSTASLGSPAEVVLTQTQFLQNYVFQLSSAAAENFNLSVPAVTHTFAVDNQSDYACTVNIIGTSSQVIIPAGGCGIVHSSATALLQLSGQYDIAFFIPGTPSSGVTPTGFIADRAMKIGIGAYGSRAGVLTAPASDEGTINFVLNKNGGSVGTISFTGGSSVGSFTVASAVSISAGDIITLVNPTLGSPDTTLSDVAITIRAGTRADA